jgi:hypothetical protein
MTAIDPMGHGGKERRQIGLPVGREEKKVLIIHLRFTRFSRFRVGLFERKNMYKVDVKW